MKGKIDKKGHLLIKRANKLINQSCMQSPIEDRCGDHCPLFGEVEKQKKSSFLSDLKEFRPEMRYIKICQNRILFFNEFSDERFE